MSEKILVFGDLHLGLSTISIDLWHDISLKLIEEMIETCINENIDTIVCCGDWHESQKQLNVKTINYDIIISNLLLKNNINLIILIGNHDCFHKNTIDITSLDIFNEHNNITIVRENKSDIIDNITLSPWSMPIPEAETDYLFGHYDIVGFEMDSGNISKNGYDPELFKKFKRVISGHYHNPSSHGNITYLGTPFQMSFGEVGFEKGYYIFENGDLKKIPFTNCPKFVKINSNSEFTKEKIEGNIVKLNFVEDYGSVKNNQIMEDVFILNPLKLYGNFTLISDDYYKENLEEFNIEIKDNNKLIEEYVNKSEFPKNINKNVLLKMINLL